MSRIGCVATVLLVAAALGAGPVRADAPAEPRVPPDNGLAALEKDVAAIKDQLAAIQKQLDSISQFLGDRQAGSFNTLDRRLRDMERQLDDIERNSRR